MKITTDIVRELLHYDPDTGVFVWRKRDRRWFDQDRYWKAWNAKNSGKVAGTVSTLASGYRWAQIYLLDRAYKAHRLAWLYMTDEPLPYQIDHINRDPLDNRWDNLRASTHVVNGRNQSVSAANTSGYTGVGWYKSREKWRVKIKIHGKERTVGYYETIVDAVAARMRANQEYGFNQGHGRERPY